MNASAKVLEVRDLKVNFYTEEGTTEAVRGVSFSLTRGKCLAIVGESGSGKSVSAYAVMRLIQKPGRIEGGEILFYPEQGEPISILKLREKDPRLYALRGGWMSMVFQEPMASLSPVHTVGNQIMEAILLHQKLSKTEAMDLSVEMLGKVGIPKPETRVNQYPYELSGGMRQRVVIAMALVCRPQLLICDEPTTALDVTLQAQILRLIRELQQELGTSVLFITHDMGVVAQVADEVCVMYKGRALEIGSVRQILKQPQHAYTKGLLSAIPHLHRKCDRLATIGDVVGGLDITTPYPLRRLPDGRWISLPDETYKSLAG